MKKVIAQTFCAATALAAAACGGPVTDYDLEAPGRDEAPIINGAMCEEGDAPTAVAIIVDATVDFSGLGTMPIRVPACGGTLIAPDVVLTASHCVNQEFLAQAVAFGFGEVSDVKYYISFEDDLSYLSAGQGEQQQELPPLPADAIRASEWLEHPSFELDRLSGGNVNGPDNFNDVGLIFLEETVDDVEPEVVITPEEAAQIDEGVDVFIAGWGLQEPSSGNPLDPPPEGSSGVKHCTPTYINEVGTHEMQIGSDAASSRKCNGDSGGPTYMEIETDHTRATRVIGITSHAYDQELCNKGGVDTRADAFYEWIDGEMKEACSKGTRVWCDVDGVIHPSFYDPPADEEEDDLDDGVTPPGADLLAAGGCSHTGPSGDGEGSEPTFLGALMLLGFALLRRRR